MAVENKNITRVRSDDNRSGDTKDVGRDDRDTSGERKQVRAPDSDGSEVTQRSGAEGGDSGVVEETEEERKLREQREEREERERIAETEILDDVETSPRYRLAVSGFNPDETAPQPAEFYNYVDGEIEKFGHF